MWFHCEDENPPLRKNLSVVDFIESSPQHDLGDAIVFDCQSFRYTQSWYLEQRFVQAFLISLLKQNPRKTHQVLIRNCRWLCLLQGFWHCFYRIACNLSFRRRVLPIVYDLLLHVKTEPELYITRYTVYRYAFRR